MDEPELPPRSQAKREAIHVAAQELFTRQGFEGTSMDAIAEAAHVSKQTLYRYYENKEALFVATLQRLALHHTAAQTLQEVQGAPIDSLAALEQALVTWAQLTVENIMQPTYLALLRVLIAELPRFPYLGSLFTSAVPQEGGAIINTLLTSATAHGVITPVDTEAAARLLAGSLLTYVFGEGLFRPDSIPQPPAPERVAALVRLFLRGMVHEE